MIWRNPSSIESLFTGIFCVLNALDGLLTKHYLGPEGEWNPLMAALLAFDPLFFLFVKIVIVNAAAVLMTHVGTKNVVLNKAIFIVTTVYSAVLICHLVWTVPSLG